MFKNLELKILAVLSAIILWFFVVGIENTAYRFPQEIQIHAINMPEKLSLSTNLGQAKLLIRGNQEAVKNLLKSDFDVSVDLKNLREGEYNLPLQATTKNDKITILKVEPQTLNIIIEPITEKEVEVKTVVTGNPQTGYIVKEVKLGTDKVVVSGGKNLLRKITEMVAPIVLDGSESTNFKENITLQFEGIEAPENVTITPQQVVVEVTIQRELQQKTVVVKPVLKGAVDLGSRKIEITPLTIAIQGKEDLLNSISFLETEPLSLDKLEVNPKPMAARLIIPVGVTLLEPKIDHVTVKLTNQTSSTP